MLPLFALGIMAPRVRKPSHPTATQPRVVKVAKDATKLYSNTVPEATKSSMQALEGEACLVHEFKEADEVEE